MVLESIIRPRRALRNPLSIVVAAIVFAFVAMTTSNILFPSEASILTIAFITILFAPFFQHAFFIEERKDEFKAQGKLKIGLFKEHSAIIKFFALFFIGIVIQTSAVFVFLPEISKEVFTLQATTLESIGSNPAGKTTGDLLNPLATLSTPDFMRILLNNLGVMLLIFVTSVLFGSGAIFILVWNASVIGVFVGVFINSLIQTGLQSGVAYLYGFPLALRRIVLHGIPEIGAYFFVAIAGGVLSVAVIREKPFSREFKEVFKDSFAFLLLAIFMIFIGAWLEVYF